MREKVVTPVPGYVLCCNLVSNIYVSRHFGLRGASSLYVMLFRRWSWNKLLPNTIVVWVLSFIGIMAWWSATGICDKVQIIIRNQTRLFPREIGVLQGGLADFAHARDLGHISEQAEVWLIVCFGSNLCTSWFCFCPENMYVAILSYSVNQVLNYQ